jgi:hypothetical protein
MFIVFPNAAGVAFRKEAKRKSVAALDKDTRTSPWQRWKKNADDERRHKQLRNCNLMVGTGRFELPTPCTPSRDNP